MLMAKSEKELSEIATGAFLRGEHFPTVFVDPSLFEEMQVRNLGARRFLGLYWRPGYLPMTRRQALANVERPVGNHERTVYLTDFGMVEIKKAQNQSGHLTGAPK